MQRAAFASAAICLVVLGTTACSSQKPAAPQPLAFTTQLPFSRPADPLVGTGLRSCKRYEDNRCSAGHEQRCAIYDTSNGQFVDPSSALEERAWLYDRWYDLYNSPEGQAANRIFTGPMPAGTPESEWSKLSHFDRYDDVGDSAIWSGSALLAATMRYLTTGTEADYERMDREVKSLLLDFDVTGIPGYLARYRFVQMDPGAPKSDQHILAYDASKRDWTDHVITDPTALAELPAVYSRGITDADGKVWQGTPMWHGDPSIDQYTGPLVAWPAALGALQDSGLKARITRQITCYLKSLKRVDIINLQQNPQALKAVQSFFAGGSFHPDPGDFDLTSLDTIVGYYHPQINSLNASTYDTSCPDHIATTPTQVLDATSDTFVLQLGAFAQDLQGGNKELQNGIDHIYVPSVRGADAVRMLMLAALSYQLTGDPMYADFMRNQLLGKLRAVDIAFTMGSFEQPKWCRSYIGNHLSFPPLWTLINLLTPSSPLRQQMEEVMQQESWQKINRTLGNAAFDVMYAGVVRPSIATGRQQAIATAVQDLEDLGGTGGVVNDPRRSYSLDPEAAIDQLTPAMGIDVTCPTEAERAACEDGFTVFGFHYPGDKITHPCTGAAHECPIGDGCADPMASKALPMHLRHWQAYMWQRNPFEFGHNFAVEGQIQGPALDFTASYWLARYYGFITQGAGHVLAWKTVGTCSGP